MIELETIRKAARLIEDHIFKTPVIYSPTLSKRFSAHIYLKLENLQKTGSFKIRGATYKLIAGADIGQISPNGVVAASAGNHAQGVALAANRAGLKATIVMPQWASISKQEATRNYGGSIIIHGATVEESLVKALEIEQQGLTFIHPFDDAELIVGQATIGLEIISEVPEVDTVLVPVGGGGLIAGTASAIKLSRPQARVIGVEAAACPSASASMRSGRREKVAATSSIADGISVKQIGAVPFEIMRDRVDDVVTVEEEYIAASIQIMLERKKILSEGAGAVPLAALLNGSIRTKPGERIVLLVSGGNVDSPLLGRIIQQGLIKNGRVMRIRLSLNDRPGTLATLLNQVAALQANILHIHHDRGTERSNIDETQVELELETRNADHIREIGAALEAAGYKMAHLSCRTC